MAEDTQSTTTAPVVPTEPAPPDDLSEWKANARKHEKVAKASMAQVEQLKAQLAEKESAQQSDTEKAITQARTEAEKSARADERKRSDARIIRAEVKAAAGGHLADPNDAVRLLDLDDFDIDDDGNLDEKAVAQAIETLLKEKPYLAAKATRVTGNGDGGARSTQTVTDDSPRGLIAAGLAAAEAERTRRT